MGEYIPTQVQITPEMIDAGVVALNRSGYGNEDGAISALSLAVQDVYLAMVATSRRDQTYQDE